MVFLEKCGNMHGSVVKWNGIGYYADKHGVMQRNVIVCIEVCNNAERCGIMRTNG